MNIEKNIPMPPKGKNRDSTSWPFNRMEVGDSIVCEGRGASSSACAGYSAAKSIQQRNPGKVFSGRKVGENQIRIWRVE